MKSWHYIVLGVIVAAGAVIYLHRQDLGLAGPSPSTASLNPSPAPGAISWSAIDRSSEGFKLEMPQDTREIEVPAFNDQGSAAEQVEMIFAFPDPATSFSLSWADNPPVMPATSENPQQTLDTARTGALARTQTVLVSESQSSRQGFPARDFIGRNQNGGIFNARLILANRRLYMLMVAYPTANSRRDGDVSHFFDSFRVVNATQNQ